MEPGEIWQDLWIVGVILVAAIAYKIWDPSGWRSLAMSHPHSGRFPDRRIRAWRAVVDDGVLAKGLWLGVSERGLHLASVDGRHRALVAWKEVAVTWGHEPDIDEVPDDPELRMAVRLEFRSSGESLSLPRSAAMELAEAAGERWPGPRDLDE